MQNIFNSPAMQHGCRAKHLFVLGIYFVFAFDLYYHLKNLNHSSGKKRRQNFPLRGFSLHRYSVTPLLRYPLRVFLSTGKKANKQILES